MEISSALEFENLDAILPVDLRKEFCMSTSSTIAQSSSATNLHQRIDAIIGLIPSDFSSRERIVQALRGRQDSIKFTAPTAMSDRWFEVSGILEELPDPVNVEWADEIAKLFSAEE